MLHMNIKVPGLLVSDKKIFKFFISKIYYSLCDLEMQRTRTIQTILVECHPDIICMTLFQNWTRALGGVVI